MNAACRETRRRLVESPERPTEHLRRCAACARFAERADAARHWLREHHAGVEPDARFAERVAARLPRAQDTPLAWAAVRLLPVTLALLLALAWFSWRTAGDGDTALEATPTEDVLAWVIDRAGEAP